MLKIILLCKGLLGVLLFRSRGLTKEYCALEMAAWTVKAAPSDFTYGKKDISRRRWMDFRQWSSQEDT